MSSERLRRPEEPGRGLVGVVQAGKISGRDLERGTDGTQNGVGEADGLRRVGAPWQPLGETADQGIWIPCWEVILVQDLARPFDTGLA